MNKRHGSERPCVLSGDVGSRHDPLRLELPSPLRQPVLRPGSSDLLQFVAVDQPSRPRLLPQSGLLLLHLRSHRLHHLHLEMDTDSIPRLHLEIILFYACQLLNTMLKLILFIVSVIDFRAFITELKSVITTWVAWLKDVISCVGHTVTT